MGRTIKVDLRSMSPFRQPDWRWLAAQEMHSQCRRAPRWQDAGIAEAVRYMKVEADRGDAAARRQWPSLSAAQSIYSGAGVIRDELEARLITGEPFEVVARKTSLALETVTAFERFFFNVSDARSANDWLLTEVVKLIPGQPVTEGQVWKYLAMAGGPVLVDLMVDDILRRPCTNPDERTELAAKARYIVREYATDWSSMPAVRSIVDEGCRLFPHLGRSINGTREEKLVAVHLQVVRMAAGLESLPEHEPESMKPGPIGSRKENSHGRPQASQA